ncbi:unnamed protein product [Cyberlindnera jadinii]|uniref:Manganese and iron superoxide dismutase n=1 Tax=Cyberlindnera jadinii (strain ATCC 18201 / CBS 1600 / BCRC 20928 / JCM 3617 / NBRC 0987 / NRRL Y-1542) TaxID=983966 RepID=A0A1E4RUB2_CYBJN|nr:manganese and iron superoxide dismutase [Cyberlindnera jadinii NRRL Y-1542]XP_020071157.1 manganese and iron superoxide dismutase [Cyberlindnera jadinii NRRL Y-1542]ODV70867.1 manganese and iron superoxide dismutase [Cyberlindnera jadinii NRRL Y-1542]ODV74118.1 manganese and iron superoxide dismutase [Cyberlindnera jadinii NRRL Y-1542]CEP23327.1 unnamed protein product [Cyberlindnera jadinii]
MFLRQSRRLLHTVPRLPVSQLPGLYSPLGFQTAWTDYQQFLTTRLTELTAGTADETRFPFYIAQVTSKDQTKQKVFNVASQAHNNHFFFQQLTSPENNHTRPSRQLEQRINEQFGSLEGLGKVFVDASDAVVGQGWLFLAERADKQLEVLALNNSGSPYQFNANQGIDLNGPVGKDDFQLLESIKQDLKEGIQDFTFPLIGISLWDQSYLIDYGLNGKKEYIKKVFDSLNWDVINSRVFKL